jgi:pyruvate formate lyase activating enzyme
LTPGGFGWCRTRQHSDGKLLTLIYGAVSSLAANPIEKKPFYHFHPGTFVLTAGSWSCNFGCPWCQNWDISKVRPPARGRYVSPEHFVQWTSEASCQGTSISFNEPMLSLEWSLDVFRLARSRGLYNTFVTNGYMTPESLSLLIDAGLDAMNVDIKGDADVGREYCKTIDVEKVCPRHLFHHEVIALALFFVLRDTLCPFLFRFSLAFDDSGLILLLFLRLLLR